ALESQPHQLLKLTLPGENLTCPGSLDGLLGLALRRKKWQLAGELLPARQFDLLPACLGIMLTLRLRQADLLQQSDESQAAALLGSSSRRRGSAVDVELPFELAEALYSQAKQVFCTALQRLYRGAITEAHKGLVFNYLGGRFHGGDSSGRGPLFCPDVIRGDSDGSDGRCLFDLMLLTHEPELLALPCATDYVDLLLASPRTFCCHLCRDSHGDRRLEGPSCSSGPVRIISSLWPERGDRLRRRLPNGCTPQVSMLVCALFNAAFLCLLGFYVYEVGEPRSHGAMMFLKLLLLFCGLSYSVQELQDVRSVKFVPGYKSMSFCKRLSWYLSYRWNLVDIAAMAFLLIGLIWIIVLDATTVSYKETTNGLSYYFARLFLAVSFIFYCMRMLSSLGYFERLGLYISITKTTIMMDVIPFLIVNAFFLASFGNNYENPTRSEMLSTGSYITEVFQRPLLAHFGEFGMDWLRQCQRDPPNSGQESERNCPHPLGNKIYTRAVLFVYLLIISIVLINVLIAKLSLTVGKEDERARVIWRSFRAQLLAEFGGEISSTPPILLAIAWIATSPARLWRCCTSRRSPTADSVGGAAAAQGHNDVNGGASAVTATATASSEDYSYNITSDTVMTTVVAKGSQGSLLSEAEKAELGGADERSSAALPWWQVAHGNNRMAPKDFREFLWFQSMQFRTVRQKFAIASRN
uniref:Ion_trans domain-containing protein n=1 Tax=Macrostomum lignano TaxID=282301 RepID=A0A1I8GH42_9PLAT